jgi:predicted DNA-binding transcriptional regulator AlpA
MNNPFETIDARLSNIENLLLDIKHDKLKNATNIPVNSPEPFLTVKQVTEELGVSRVTLLSWEKQELIKPHRIGRRVYFLRSELIQRKESAK